jgi:proline iminopeptidase
MRELAWGVVALAMAGCGGLEPDPSPPAAPPSVAAAPTPGVRRVPVTTARGTFEVWTRRAGDNPKVKLLVLHGGPGASHSYLLALERPLVEAGFEVYFYDQLGGGASDRPHAPELWELPRFVDEVEQVRRALGLGPDSFYLYGHSWGGILALEYALAHPDRLAGLVISNMMSSAPAYDAYAEQVLLPAVEPAAREEIRRLEAAGAFDDPRYMELLIPHYYERHVLRRPAAEWPAEVNQAFEQINREIYVPLQGPSELGIRGTLERWDRSGDLARIAVPALVIGARHDTMDPAHMAWMATQLPNGRYHFCPEGSHLAMWDDADAYFDGLLAFLRDAEDGRLEAPAS